MKLEETYRVFWDFYLRRYWLIDHLGKAFVDMSYECFEHAEI